LKIEPARHDFGSPAVSAFPAKVRAQPFLHNMPLRAFGGMDEEEQHCCSKSPCDFEALKSEKSTLKERFIDGALILSLRGLTESANSSVHSLYCPYFGLGMRGASSYDK
jgi:hypothetical protein